MDADVIKATLNGVFEKMMKLVDDGKFESLKICEGAHYIDVRMEISRDAFREEACDDDQEGDA